MPTTPRGIPVSKATMATPGFVIPQASGEALWYSIEALPEWAYREHADASGRSRQEAIDAATQARNN